MHRDDYPVYEKHVLFSPLDSLKSLLDDLDMMDSEVLTPLLEYIAQGDLEADPTYFFREVHNSLPMVDNPPMEQHELVKILWEYAKLLGPEIYDDLRGAMDLKHGYVGIVNDVILLGKRNLCIEVKYVRE